MRRMVIAIAVMLAGSLLAAPALAQEIDSPAPGGTGVLVDRDPPEDEPPPVQPPPGDRAPEAEPPGDQPRVAEADAPAAERPAAEQPAPDQPDEVVAADREGPGALATTGLDLTVGMALLAAALLALGAGVLAVSRRRARAHG
jgi:hypothetical protein